VKQLIVTADDFGAAREVNEAVETAHRCGILTTASLMVTAPAAADAIARARTLPLLRVGLHLVLADGRALLPPAAVHRLVREDGCFRDGLASLGALLAVSRQARRQLAAEIDAQFAAFRDSGLELDHCNAHRHFHLHPLIGALLVKSGRRFGLQAVRVPLEPTGILRRIERSAPRAPASLLAPFALMLRARLRAAGLAVTDRCFGITWSGQMTRERLAALILALPPGLSEIYLHPATRTFAGAAAGYRYHEELEALLAPEISQACRSARVSLGGFGDFRGTPGARAAPFPRALAPAARRPRSRSARVQPSTTPTSRRKAAVGKRLQSAVFALDSWLRRRYGIYEYSASPRCLFRIGHVRIEDAVELADGTSVPAGSRVLALHLWNEHLAAIAAAGPGVAWARRVDRAVQRSLVELSGYLAANACLDDIRALRGDMRVRGARQAAQFARIAVRYGFEVHGGQADRPGMLRRFGDGLLIAMLTAVTNPFASRSALFRHRNVRIYLSRAVLTERYARRPRTTSRKRIGMIA
jgi:chitin disaccharide deacetylase